MDKCIAAQPVCCFQLLMQTVCMQRCPALIPACSSAFGMVLAAHMRLQQGYNPADSA
jgi:hypothetical protein